MNAYHPDHAPSGAKRSFQHIIGTVLTSGPLSVLLPELHSRGLLC